MGREKVTVLSVIKKKNAGYGGGKDGIRIGFILDKVIWDIFSWLLIRNLKECKDADHEGLRGKWKRAQAKALGQDRIWGVTEMQVGQSDWSKIRKE